jgi:hypothetical protein
VCQGGTCAECPTACTPGSRRCGADGAVETCELTASGCRAFVVTGQCDVAAGERCDQGACLPTCSDACAAGAVQCSAAGRPQRCEVGPTGCRMWRDDAPCGSDQRCVDGACRTRCSDDEFETCPTGLVCTGTADGRLCLPENPGMGTGGGNGSGAGGGTGAGGSAPPATGGGGGATDDGGPSVIGAQAMGCGCAAVEPAALLCLAGLLLARRRARRP